MTDEELKILREWDTILRNMSHFVQLDKVKGIKFEIRTNENANHNRQHLHVSTSSASMSIAIDNGDILACSGKISPAQKKWARDWLDKNRKFVIDMWNKYSNGLPIIIQKKSFKKILEIDKSIIYTFIMH